MNNKPSGFTLIELVIVIVVLGILAVTAMPRLINLQTDARIAALNGLKGGMQSAADMVYPIAIKEGLTSVSSTTISIEGDPVSIAYGYPAAFSRQTWSKLIEATFADAIHNSNDPADWYFHNPGGGDEDNSIRFMPKSRIKPSDNCYLIYSEATETDVPHFEFVTSGC